MRTINVVLSFFVLLLSTSITRGDEQPIIAQQAMVVSEVKSASQIGIDILKAGGNAIDAAVAVGYALSVVNPCCGNIGGGGFMLIHLAKGNNIFINFREKAPLAATKHMFLDANGNLIPGKTTHGYLAIAVPGTPLGLDTALQKFGTMKREEVMAPAIRLALDGHTVTKTEAKWFQIYAKEFRKQSIVAKIFLKDGKPYKEGERLFQRDLGNTLMLISKYGTRAFYEGPIAHEIVKASQKAGGILSLQDFADYRVEILKPIDCSYRNYALITSPPPSSGGIALCEMLNILENFDLKEMRDHSLTSLRYIIESMRYGFWDRNRELGDTNFVKVPVDKLISKNYAFGLSEQIRHTNFIVRHDKMSKHELTDTTHYSIVDKEGNAVAVTYTINGFFGAEVIAGDTGFFLNDEMDDFTAQLGGENKFGLVQSSKNEIAPGKRPLSSMSPTILLKNNRVFMVLGSPGGPRIITSVLLTILNVIDYGMNIKQAINTPRFHYQGIPDTIDIEPFLLPFFTQKKLEYLGYHFTSQDAWGAVEAILIDENGKIFGANDYRRPDGAAIGY